MRRSIVSLSLGIALLVIGGLLPSQRVTAERSTNQFTVVADNGSVSGPTPPAITGRFPQTGEQENYWLLVIGSELIILAGLGVHTLRRRGGRHA